MKKSSEEKEADKSATDTKEESESSDSTKLDESEDSDSDNGEKSMDNDTKEAEDAVETTPEVENTVDSAESKKDAPANTVGKSAGEKIMDNADAALESRDPAKMDDAQDVITKNAKDVREYKERRAIFEANKGRQGLGGLTSEELTNEFFHHIAQKNWK